MPARRKRMTQREKRERAEVKRELQKKGIIPPDKPRLNRKKFVDEAMKEWDTRPECCVWEIYLAEACGFLLGKTEGKSLRVSQEAVGAAKVLKLAIRLYQFHKKLKDEGRTEYKLSEEWEYVRDILDA